MVSYLRFLISMSFYVARVPLLRQYAKNNQRRILFTDGKMFTVEEKWKKKMIPV